MYSTQAPEMRQLHPRPITAGNFTRKISPADLNESEIDLNSNLNEIMSMNVMPNSTTIGVGGRHDGRFRHASMQGFTHYEN